MPLIQHVPMSTPPSLTLTVNPRGKVYLSRELCLRLGLRHGQGIELIPPTARRGGTWYLYNCPDAPVPKLTLYVGKDYKPQFNTRQVLSPTRFRDTYNGGKLLPKLTLELQSDAEQPSPGYHVLKPVYHAVPIEAK